MVLLKLQTYLRYECGNMYSLEELRNLKHLVLPNRYLTSVPKEIGELKNLIRLDLSSNELTSIPKEIYELKNLKWLDLRKNKLTSIPKEIKKLNIIYLNISNNNITINKSEKDLIKFLDRFSAEYQLSDDSLITDLLI